MANKAAAPLAIVVSVLCAKCLIESVLVNKRLPNRLPTTVMRAAIASLRANSNLS
jgi:hypothetical protein